MSSFGRRRKSIWEHFTEVPQNETSKKGKRATCKKCGKELQGFPNKFRKHLTVCNNSGSIIRNETGFNFTLTASSSTSTSAVSSNETTVREPPQKVKKINPATAGTSQDRKNELDKQVARFIFSENLPFQVLENKEFIKLCSMLRREYKSPSMEHMSNELLNVVFEEENQKDALNQMDILKNEIVTLSLKGWSNIHEPIVSSYVCTTERKVILLDITDVSENPHTAEDLLKLVSDVIKKTEGKFQCKVRSVVIDVPANISGMREELKKKDLNVITYGCGSYILNLLAEDVIESNNFYNSLSYITSIIKYFQNNYTASVWYKERNGTTLQTPVDFRWNSLYESLESYSKNWSILCDICETQKNEIDKRVYQRVCDREMNKLVKYFVEILKSIAKALDEIQNENCTIAESVKIWKELNNKFTEISREEFGREIMKKFEERYNMAITEVHLAAALLSPRNLNNSVLTKDEKDRALEYMTRSFNSDLEKQAWDFSVGVQEGAFQRKFRQEDFSEKVTDSKWWKHFKSYEEDSLPQQIYEDILGFVGAVPSSLFLEMKFVYAPIRRIHLGAEKTSKLIFVTKSLKNKQ